MKNNIKIALVSGIIFAFFITGIVYFSRLYLQSQGDVAQVETFSEEYAVENTSQEREQTDIFVHVCGAVKAPGVYRLTSESRVCDAIAAAGGLKKKAADTDVNQAELLEDGQQVIIPYRKSKKEVKKENEVASSEESKLNLNTASHEELMSLPGIGDAKASSIIQYREQHGNFSSIEDIKNITGIKDGVYAKIEAYISV